MWELKVQEIGGEWRGKHTQPRGVPSHKPGHYIVVHKVDLRQSEGVVEAHEDGRLDCDVDEVEPCIAQEVG